MRLLHTETLEFIEFFDSNIPEYAILSHRWLKDELSFRDMKPRHRASIQHKQGFVKVQAFARKAADAGYHFCWIDTCCIDKRSSAELSEAINSMYRWYQNAGVCFAYIHDLSTGGQWNDVLRSQFTDRVEIWRRHWTLQELLAPREVIFFDSEWVSFGTREGLAALISTATQIEVKYLSNTWDIVAGCPAALKFSWASNRNASRIEDEAYSLLGLLGINMPLLSGEGRNAFMRLQKEVIEQNGDLSILAWTVPSARAQSRRLSSSIGPVLADNARCFRDCNPVANCCERECFNRVFVDPFPAAQISHKGLRVTTPLLRSERPVPGVMVFFPLGIEFNTHCRVRSYKGSAIQLAPLTRYGYDRVLWDGVFSCKSERASELSREYIYYEYMPQGVIAAARESRWVLQPCFTPSAGSSFSEDDGIVCEVGEPEDIYLLTH